MKKKGIIDNNTVLIGVLAILIIVVMSSGCTNIFTNNSTMSESDYKASCQAVQVSDLINNPDNYTGKNVKLSGKIIVMSTTTEITSNGTSKSQNISMIMVVNDSTKILPNGTIPVYVTMNNFTGNITVKDIITVYGVFNKLNKTYNSFTSSSSTSTSTKKGIDSLMSGMEFDSEIISGIGDKYVPMITARYMEVVQS